MITRIAPTPSGFLHVGNAVNFLLTDWLARSRPGSRLRLRIDDLHLAHVPERFLADVFWAVDWLGIAVTDGPGDATAITAGWSQRRRLPAYRTALRGLTGTAPVYVCACSRTTVAARAAGAPDPCRSRDLPLHPGATAVRYDVHAARPGERTRAALTRVGVTLDDIAGAMGDFVVWRRDDLPAYQLACVVDDRDAGVDTIVRGEDLRMSTAAQLLLAGHLGAHGFTDARFVHHPLVRDHTGAKLSKRDDADALHTVATTEDGRERLRRLATAAAAAAGIAAPG